MSSGLSDVLRQMAEGEPAPPQDDAFDSDEAAEATPPAPVAEPPAARRQRPASPRPAAEVPPAGPAPARPARPVARRRNSNHQLKAVATPIVFTLGLLLLFPAMWGTLVLMGQDIWRSDKPDAATVAKAMLICWPLSLALVGLAVVMFLQVKSAERDD